VRFLMAGVVLSHGFGLCGLWFRVCLASCLWI